MTVFLKEILTVLHNPTMDGDPSVRVAGVTHDSRLVQPGWVFVAVPGEKTDGHDFIGKAVEAGAAAIIAQRPRQKDRSASLPWVTVADTRKVLGPVASVVHGRPTDRLVVVGITGTNGKTSLTFLLEAIAKAAGASPAVVGTISYRWGGKEQAASHTTPEASGLQEMFAHMVRENVSHVFMEVSSHGLYLGRLDGCRFDVGVFTNLTQDHLDFHGSFEEYYQAKRSLFCRLLPDSSKENSLAVVNLDDPYGRRLVREVGKLPVIGYGLGEECQVRPREVSMTATGMSATVQTPRGLLSLRTPLTGKFNLQNILAAVAVAEGLAIPHEAVRQGIESLQMVPGRLERIPSAHGMVFVDYAHTPDALKNVLNALHDVRSGRIITVMGCGGDRDKTKRPVMGREAAAGSDFVVVTSDNPRTEDPLAIIQQIEDGVREYGFSPSRCVFNGQPLKSGQYRVIPDRGEAIAWAVNHIENNDILLVAGKGHETYQEINGVRHAFDDREVLRNELHKLAGRNNGQTEAAPEVAKGATDGPESEKTRA